MFGRSLIGTSVLAATLLMTITGAWAFDETKYPDLKGQWRRGPKRVAQRIQRFRAHPYGGPAEGSQAEEVRAEEDCLGSGLRPLALGGTAKTRVKIVGDQQRHRS